jgi:hypothetical protein
MQPLFWWRAWRERDRYSLAIVAIFAAGALVQLASIAVDGRHAANLADPSNLARIWTFRAVAGALLGQTISFHLVTAGVPIIFGFILAVLVGGGLLWLWWHALERPLRIAVAFVWLAFVVTPVFAQTEGVRLLSWPGGANRYFLIPTAMTAIVVFAGFARLRRYPDRLVAIAGAVLLAVGIGGDFRLLPLPFQNWAQHSACIGTPSPCVVPVYEPGDWSIVWPGTDGQWTQPRPGG